VRIVPSMSDCRSTETAVSWNVQGPQGEQGPQGPTGPAGPPGEGVLEPLELYVDCAVDSLKAMIDTVPWGTPANITIEGACAEPERLEIRKSNITVVGASAGQQDSFDGQIRLVGSRNFKLQNVRLINSNIPNMTSTEETWGAVLQARGASLLEFDQVAVEAASLNSSSSAVVIDESSAATLTNTTMDINHPSGDGYGFVVARNASRAPMVEDVG
jgi:flagellar basal body rod protein FlgC